MKKLLTLFSLILTVLIIQAQPPTKPIDGKIFEASYEMQKVAGYSNIPPCFCCGEAYNLNAPAISGPDVIECTGTFKWTWNKCEGAIVGHNFSPFPAGASAGGDNVSVTLNLTGAWSGTTTLTVTFMCGNKKVTVQKKITVKECCDCSKIPEKLTITGPSFWCLEKPCKDEFTYSVPKFSNDTCIKYNWIVSSQNGSVIFSGQGTNQINFNCDALKPGTYTISLRIFCGGKWYSGSTTLTVCQKADPEFTLTTTGTSITVSSTVGCTNKWYLFEDKNNNGQHDPPAEYPVYGQIGNSATFNGLTPGKLYIVHHYVECSCGNSQNICRSFMPKGAWIFLPQLAKSETNSTPTPTLKIVDNKTMQMKEISPQILNQVKLENK